MCQQPEMIMLHARCKTRASLSNWIIQIRSVLVRRSDQFRCLGTLCVCVSHFVIHRTEANAFRVARNIFSSINNFYWPDLLHGFRFFLTFLRMTTNSEWCGRLLVCFPRPTVTTFIPKYHFGIIWNLLFYLWWSNFEHSANYSINIQRIEIWMFLCWKKYEICYLPLNNKKTWNQHPLSRLALWDCLGWCVNEMKANWTTTHDNRIEIKTRRTNHQSEPTSSQNQPNGI